MDERRKLPRKHLIIYSRVFDQPLGKLLGYLSDLSEQGAMIIADAPLDPNKIMPLHLDLPDPKIFHAHHLTVEARVAHCEVDISPEFFDIGLEFLNVEPEQKIIIQKMMDVYEFRR